MCGGVEIDWVGRAKEPDCPDNPEIPDSPGATLSLGASPESPAENVGRGNFPRLDAAYSMKTGELGKITSEGGLLLVGKRLEWDALAPDESFFLNYEGVETKFIVTGDPSKTSVALVTTQVLEEGDSAEVWFHTRKGTATGTSPSPCRSARCGFARVWGRRRSIRCT